jgi:tRNA-dihydrouridine synthase
MSVAPMMDWTDRHCRYFLRGFSPRTLLYTEMITAEALLRGDAAQLLRALANKPAIWKSISTAVARATACMPVPSVPA